MTDSFVTVLDATGTSRQIEAELVGSSFQQLVAIGDGVNAGRLVVIDSTGHLSVREPQSATGTLTQVAGSASTGVLLASNASRLGASIYNDSTAILYVAVAATASTTAHTVQVPAQGYYEQPFKYTGIISGIWASATGNARITEYT